MDVKAVTSGQVMSAIPHAVLSRVMVFLIQQAFVQQQVQQSIPADAKQTTIGIIQNINVCLMNAVQQA